MRGETQESSNDDFGLTGIYFRMRYGVRTTVTAVSGTGSQRFLDDGFDGPGASPAFRAAPQTSVNLLG